MPNFHFYNQGLATGMLNKTKHYLKHRWLVFLICLLGLQNYPGAQPAGCNSMTFAAAKLEPCRYRITVMNQSVDCYRTIRLLLPDGEFKNWSVNSGAGWIGEQLSPTELELRHTNGIIPVGNSWAIDFTYFIPGMENTLLSLLYDNQCIGEGCFVDIPLTGCKEGCIEGVIYRECMKEKYANQAVLADWTVTLFDLNNNFIDEKLSGADGKYKFCGLPPGNYIIRQTVNPAWDANIPGPGSQQIQVGSGQTRILNFGNCPQCSCDSIALFMSQDLVESDSAYYTLSIFNKAPFCFEDIEIKVAGADFVKLIERRDTNWKIETIIQNEISRLKPPGGIIPEGVHSPIRILVSGGTEHLFNLSVKHIGDTGFTNCLFQIPYPVKPINRSCCPGNTIPGNELVFNGAFNITTPSPTHPGFNSAYQYVFPPLSTLNPGQVTISNQSTMPNGWICPGLTGPIDNFLVVFGSSNLNPVWRQNNIGVVPGNYVFCANFKNVNPYHANPIPQIEIWINNQQVNSFTLLPFQTSWTQISIPYTSITTGSIPLEIRVSGNNAGRGFAIDNISFRSCSKSCDCRQNSLITMNVNQMSYPYVCGTKPFVPVIPCPKTQVCFLGDFGCFDALDSLCPSAIKYKLYGPTGLTQQGLINPSSGTPNFQICFPPATFATGGAHALELTTLCPGKMDSCVCRYNFIFDCCKCGIFEMIYEDSSGFHGFAQCDTTIMVNELLSFSALFSCIGLDCTGPVIDWNLTGPPGYLSQNGQVIGPAFTIPALSPANFTIPGLYTLDLIAYCGGDTCPCTVKFCIKPLKQIVRDTTICRTATSAYIPIANCYSNCGVSQVRWFLKPCSSTVWPSNPYQVSSGPGCSDLLLLPYQYPNETCVEVYAEITMNGNCCGITKLTSNIGKLFLCNPISCNIINPNSAGFCNSGLPAPLSVTLSGVNCQYSVAWYYQNNLVSNTTTYQPPLLTFLGGPNDCYYDHVFTVKVTGVCGVTSCNTSIRVYKDLPHNGQIKLNPFEQQPFCPGEDATLEYTNICSGPPPKWSWYSSLHPLVFPFTPIQNSGSANNIYNTNKLFNTIWYMVESQNGVCPAKKEIFQVEVYPTISINSFTETHDPCADAYLTLTVDFTTTSILSNNCQYEIQWYQNGLLIQTDYSTSSPVSYQYFGPDVEGIYYAIVKYSCCDQKDQSVPVIINPVCMPKISGPCFVCENETITLQGTMVLPPNDPCPTSGGCTFSWYSIDPNTGALISLNDFDNATTISTGGNYVFQSDCNGCIKRDTHAVKFCPTLRIGTEDGKGGILTKVKFHPNPTTGDLNISFSPNALRSGFVEILDLYGKILQKDFLIRGKTEHKIKLDEFNPGIYIILVYESEQLIWKELIVKSK